MFDFFKRRKTENEILSHADYNEIFENTEVEGLPVEEINIGLLQVPTGAIVVCDPLVYFDDSPLTKRVEPGAYPIKIYSVKTPNFGKRYAIAKLEINDDRAIKWVLALREGEDINKLAKAGADFFGFPVDAGLGSFFDAQAGDLYNEFVRTFMKKHPEGNVYDDFFAAEFKKNAQNRDDPMDYGDWINFQLPNSDLNITMFQSGFGDGLYPAYWGLNEKGNIVSLVIDFFVLLLPDK